MSLMTHPLGQMAPATPPRQEKPAIPPFSLYAQLEAAGRHGAGIAAEAAARAERYAHLSQDREGTARAGLLAVLATGTPLSAKALVERLGCSRGTITYQLGKLVDLGQVVRREGKCPTYSLTTQKGEQHHAT